MNDYYVYILTNKSHTTLYIGVTNNLERRMAEHRAGTVPGFTSHYNLTKLVYFEQGIDAEGAIHREKQIKKWRRSKKEALIASYNPDWTDLADLSGF